MTVEQSGTSIQGKHDSGFELTGFAHLALLLFLMLIYPLLGMVWHHQYPVVSFEILLILILFLLTAGILSLLLHRYCRPAVTNIVLVTIMVLVFLVQFNLFFIGLISTIISGLVVSVILAEKFPATLLVVIAALITGSYFDNHFDLLRNSPGLDTAQTPSGHGPLIHILMDGFIGPDGLPQSKGAQDLRAEMMAFFEAHDFQVHTRAYTHYSSTIDSMARALNFRNDNENLYQRTVVFHEPISIRENAWFSALSSFGYPIVVYQNESVNFCESEPSAVDHCNVFTIPNLKTIHSDVDGVGTRALLLLRNLMGQFMIFTKTVIDHNIMEAWGVSYYDKRMLADLARDVQLHPGYAYFAHILLPHSPLVYRQDCSLDYESESWLRYPASVGLLGNSDETRRMRYEKFVLNAKCALRELGTLFNAIKEAGLYERATIVVHGDHGTSAYNYSASVHNIDKLTYRDMREIFSTLFAVKYPGGSFRVNSQITSLNVLMAQTISEITGKSPEELGISVVDEDEPFVYLGDVMPLQMVYLNIFKRSKQETNSSE